MLTPFRLDRRAISGGLVGIGASLLSAVLPGRDLDHVAYSIVPLLAIAVVGLVLGARAAFWGYVTAVVVLLLIAAGINSEAFLVSDYVRFTAFLIGTPIVVFLVYRVEMARRVATAALATSHAAEQRAEAERMRLENVRQDAAGALAAAERERARLEEVAEAIPEPLVVYDDELRGTYGNRAALRLFGRSFVERPLDEWGRATEPRDEGGTLLPRDAWPQVTAQTRQIRQRLLLRNPMSGRDVLVDVEGTPIPGGGAVLLLRDVGKEEDERRRLSRFASFVAHELRNPLAVAKARIELAQRDVDQSPKAAGHGARALESVDAAIGILERLELYSRADSGHVEAGREAFALAPALDAAVERLRTRGSEREVRVVIPPGIGVVGDRHLSEQAITNLLTNADRYSSPAAPIHVEVTDEDPVTLRVRDDGPGIADDVADRLFRDRLAVGRGLGLGLYLVHATMAAMGGSVQLEQRRPVAVFALRWPRAST